MGCSLGRLYEKHRTMLRITIVCSSLVRLGPTNVMYNMLEAYCKQPNDVRFEIITISEELQDTRKQDFEKLGINITSCNIQPGMGGICHLKKLRALILFTKPDIVHSYGFRADCMVGMMKLSGIIKVSSLFNNPHEDYPMLFGKIKGKLMAMVHLNIYRKFDKIIVCSNFISDKIKAFQLPVSVIYTGVPSDYFVPLSDIERQNKRAELNIPDDTKVWLFIGNLIPRKNPLFLISVFKKLKLKDAILMIMGDGPLMEDCKVAIAQDKDNNIRLIGAQPGTLEYLQISDFYISASYSEGFPTAVLEAMSVGVLPILSDIIPHMEMVSNFSSSCIFKNDDFVSLAKVVSENMTNPVKLKPREYLLSNFSAHIMQKRYIDCYHSLFK